MERRNGNDTSTFQTDLRETFVMQRHLEDRQGSLQNEYTKLYEQVNGKDGLKEQLMTLRILTEQRHKAAVCVGKWIAGITGTLFVLFATWVTIQVWSVRDRDMARQLLQAPTQQQGPGPK